MQKRIFGNEFARSNSGSVGLIFAVALGVALIMTGVAIDYGSATANRQKLQGAIDASVIAVAKEISSTKDAAPTAARYQPLALANLTANLPNISGLSIDQLMICTSVSCVANDGAPVAQGQVYLRASALSPRKFSGVIPVSMGKGGKRDMPIGAYSVATMTGSDFVDLYVLVDVSQSMGLGASPADQAGMISTLGCAFACHTGTPTPADARAAGYTLRIDAIKSGLKSIAAQAKAAGNVRIGIYTFANNFTTVLPISSFYGNTTDTCAAGPCGSVYGAINSLEIAAYEAGTTIPYALDQMAKIAPASGSGKSQNSARTYVLLATDGMANAIYNAPNGDWVNDVKWGPYVPKLYTAAQWEKYLAYEDWTGGSSPAINSGVACPDYLQFENAYYNTTTVADLTALYGKDATPCIAQPNWKSYAQTAVGKYLAAGTGNATSQDLMAIQAIDPAWCAPLKNKGTNLLTLYATYHAVPPGELQPYVAQAGFAVAPKIWDNMKACASSPSGATLATDTASIVSSVEKIYSGMFSDKNIRLAK